MLLLSRPCPSIQLMERLPHVEYTLTFPLVSFELQSLVDHAGFEVHALKLKHPKRQTPCSSLQDHGNRCLPLAFATEKYMDLQARQAWKAENLSYTDG